LFFVFESIEGVGVGGNGGGDDDDIFFVSVKMEGRECESLWLPLYT